jgi:CDP-glucose 4,6-dehydratase
MNSSFWKNRKVLVTGHTGFKGSWLCVWLQMLGTRVSGYALDPPTEPSLFEVARVADGMDSHHGDVRDLDSLRRALSFASPEIVIHMAAQAIVRKSYAHPVETFATNVMGTVNLLEAVRGCDSVRAVLIITSDKCYENKECIWGYREDDPMGGHDPYSASKGAAELVVSAYRRSFFANVGGKRKRVGIATARAGNVIGGGDWAEDRLIPDFFRAVLAKKKLVVRSPSAIRPWQHVLEPLSGYLALSEQLWKDPAHTSGAWNFGPDVDALWSVSDLADELVCLWGTGAGWKVAATKNPLHEAGILALDCSKARIKLGWQPCLALGNALNLTVEWCKSHAGGKDMRKFTESQVREYIEGIKK